MQCVKFVIMQWVVHRTCNFQKPVASNLKVGCIFIRKVSHNSHSRWQQVTTHSQNVVDPFKIEYVISGRSWSFLTGHKCQIPETLGVLGSHDLRDLDSSDYQICLPSDWINDLDHNLTDLPLEVN